jgi:tetratricopeptide (TPR) repeat protein
MERGHVPFLRPIAEREMPLIDRVEEIRLLREAVNKTVQGEGGLIFIQGEPGIGKTRLTREAEAYARLHGMQVLRGRCPALFKLDSMPPYIQWSEVIRDYLETCTPETLFRVIGYYPSEVAKLVPEIRQKLVSLPQSFPIDPEQEQSRLFEAVSQFITNISRETPLLVILDDLQLSDPSSLLLLHYIARGIQKVPLLIVGAYRGSNIDSKHPLTQVLLELNRDRLSQSISLKRMSPEDVCEMIKQQLEQDNIPTEFCKMIYDKTKGNPFFVEEVIKSLKDDEVINREENKWKIKEVSKIQFPESVKSVMKARIGRLDDERQNILTLASFVGNDFTPEAIGALTGIEKSKLLEIMESMFKTGLIKERVVRGEGVCSFADALVRDVVYEEVSPLKAKELHGVVGNALEKTYGNKIDGHYGELAFHFLESGDKDKALNYFMKAAEKAEKIHANTEAASYLQSANKLLHEDENKLSEQASVLERLGDVKQLAGEYDACEDYWNESLALWKRLFEEENAARINRKIANLLWKIKADTEKAKVHQGEALKILERLPEGVELARLLADMARMYSRTENETEALSLANRATKLAEKLNASEIIASSYGTLGMVFAEIKGDRKKALEYYEKSLQIALENDYMESALRAYNNICAALEDEHDHEKALEIGETGLKLAKKIGAIFWIIWTGSGLADTYISMGNINKGITQAEESATLAKKAANISGLGFSLSVLGRAYQILGEREKSEQFLTEALDIAKKAEDIQQTCISHRNLGILYYEDTEYAKAKEQFKQSFDLCEKAGWTYRQALDSLWLSRVDIEQGDMAEAKKFLDMAKKTAIESKDRQLIAIVDATTGTLLRNQKAWKESIESFEKSLHGFESFNAKRWAVPFFSELVLYEYARVYFERNQEGDREKARQLLAQALELFQKMGAKKNIEKVETTMAQMGTGIPITQTQTSGHLPIGYPDLDNALHGGLPQEYAVILTSPTCDERNMIIQSFLETGAKRGEVTFYVSIDLGTVKPLLEKYQSLLNLVVCNPHADSIIKDMPNVSKLKGVENLTDISIALSSQISRLDPSLKGLRRICIELLSDVLLQHHAVHTRRWLISLITELKSNKFTSLAVIDPRIHPSEELYAILGLFDGEISLHEKQADKKHGKYLKINRMSDQKYLEDELPFKR